MLKTNRLSLLVPEPVVSATLVKYAVTNAERPPCYNVIRITLNEDGTVKEENPCLQYVWDGEWWHSEMLDGLFLMIKTPPYVTVINLTVKNRIYTAIEYRDRGDRARVSSCHC